MATPITQAVLDGLPETLRAIIVTECQDRIAKALPAPTLEEIRAIHPKKFDPNYVPPPLSKDAIRVESAARTDRPMLTGKPVDPPPAPPPPAVAAAAEPAPPPAPEPAPVVSVPQVRRSPWKTR